MSYIAMPKVSVFAPRLANEESPEKAAKCIPQIPGNLPAAKQYAADEKE